MPITQEFLALRERIKSALNRVEPGLGEKFVQSHGAQARYIVINTIGRHIHNGPQLETMREMAEAVEVHAARMEPWAPLVYEDRAE